MSTLPVLTDWRNVRTRICLSYPCLVDVQNGTFSLFILFATKLCLCRILCFLLRVVFFLSPCKRALGWEFAPVNNCYYSTRKVGLIQAGVIHKSRKYLYFVSCVEPGNGFLSIGGEHAHIYRTVNFIIRNFETGKPLTTSLDCWKARLVRTAAHLISPCGYSSYLELLMSFLCFLFNLIGALCLPSPRSILIHCPMLLAWRTRIALPVSRFCRSQIKCYMSLPRYPVGCAG